MSSPSSEFIKKHEIVRAGAGAGKTYTLTHKVMDIAADFYTRNKCFPKVVVTTFTRKATQELRERLMVLALDEKPELIDFINSRSHLVVSTMHGVMDLYLKRYGGQVCVDSSYRIIETNSALKMARQILRQLMLSNDEYAPLLERFSFNALVDLVRTLDRLKTEHPDATPFDEEHFSILFAEKAASVSRLLEVAADKIHAESTQAAWLSMADEYRRLAGILREDNWVGRRGQFLAVLDGMKTARRSAKAPPVTDSTADEAEEAREAAKELRSSVFDPSEWKQFSESFALLERLSQEFTRLFTKEKLAQGQLEIADLELYAMSCMRQHSQTVRAFAQEWDYWLIDEYQDTSPFQVELLRHLTGDRPQFIVGDPQQSIYLFRGARSEVFAEKTKEISDGGGALRSLTVNRRSRPELLLFMNDFFASLKPRFQAMDPFIPEGKVLEAKRVVARIFIPDEIESLAETTDETTDETTELETSSKTKADDALRAATREMKGVVAHIQGLVASGVALEDICVLGRTNRVLSEVALWLSRYHIPTHVHVAAGFYDRRETRDALALLRFLVNPFDNANLIELLRSPWFMIPDRTLVELTIERPESVWEALQKAGSLSSELSSVSRLRELLQQSRKMGLSEAFRVGLVESGFVDLSHEHDVSGRRESNIWKLMARLKAEERQPGFNPLAFIAGSLGRLSVDDSQSEGDAVASVEPARVNLMTVHASKGLEFKHVILPQMGKEPKLTVSESFTYHEELNKWAFRIPLGEDGKMTASLAERIWLEKFQKHEIEEHARVLYVALTRAVETVFMSWTGQPKRNSWAEMVKLDLAEGIHATESYQYEVSRSEPVVQMIHLSDEALLTPRRKWQEGGANATQVSVSVTEILDQKSGVHLISQTNADVSRRLSVASEGSLVHRLMELLKYPSQDRLTKLIQKWFPGREDRVLAAVEFVRELKNPPLLEIIKNGEVEYGFAFVENGSLIEGQIDLWGRTDAGQLWIVDYKTGGLQYKQKAFDQMMLYAMALRRSGLVGDGEKIQLMAVYPFEEQVFSEPEPTPEQYSFKFPLALNRRH